MTQIPLRQEQPAQATPPGGIFRWFRTSLRAQLGVTFTAMAVASILIVAILLAAFTLSAARSALQEKAFSELKAVRTLKSNQIRAWLADRKGDVLFARNLVVVKGTEGVNEGLPVLAKYKNDPSNPAYVEAFNRAENVLGAFADEIGGGVYRDIMLVDLEGDVVFALDVESRGTQEANSVEFQNGLQLLYVGDIVYVPVHDELDLRITAPVVDDSGKTIGVIFMELELEAINDIMHERTGLGESGETYLVGQDNLFRNDSRFLDQLGFDTTILNPDVIVDTEASRSGLTGKSGIQTIDDYRGVPVLSAWSPIAVQEPTAADPDGVRWALMAEIDESEALAAVNQLTNLITVLTSGLVLGGGAIAVVLGAWTANRLVRPIVGLTESATAMAGGNLDISLTTTREDEVGVLTHAFTSMATQLKEILEGLEQRVADRTRALATSAEVSRRLSTILDQKQLVSEVVEQVQSAFGYYHAHIYLVDEATKDLVMAGGTGEAGREMLSGGHKIPWGRGLTGRAAETNSIVLVPDVSQEEGWLSNPLLPDTKAEIAVPVALGDRVLGVLDVQHNVTGGLDEGSASLLQSVAGQVAIALQNTRVFTEVQQRAEHKELIGRITQRIQSTTTIEGVLQTAARDLGRALRAQRASVQLALATDGGHPRD